MVFNRLRDFRKSDIGISSTEKMAELLGGEEQGWYHQKIQRIETGQTSLSDQDAHHIAKTFNVPISVLFEEPKNHLGEKFQKSFASAPEHVQKTIKTLLGIDE